MFINFTLVTLLKVVLIFSASLVILYAFDDKNFSSIGSIEFMLSTLRQHSKETRHDGKNLQKEIEKMGEQVEGFTNMKQR